MLELKVQEPYFNQICRGLKLVEGRVAKPKYASLEAGHPILINGELQIEVVAVRRYPSFLEMLEKEGLDSVLPGLESIEEGVSVYRQFYSVIEEKKYGVVAILIK